MNRTPHILFVCSGLHYPGGIERAIVNTVNLLHQKGHNVGLLILENSSESFYPVHPDIKITTCTLEFGIHNRGNTLQRKIDFTKNIFQLKTLLQNLAPQLIITTEYIYTIAAKLACGNKQRIFSWEHHHFYHLKKSRFWQILFKKIYPKIDGVTCLNTAEANLFKTFGCTTVVIPNFIVSAKSCSTQKDKILLTIGWLIYRKGVDLIPEIAKAIAIKHPAWKWKIIGKATDEFDLKGVIEKEGLQDFIELAEPVTPDLAEQYTAASLYVLTSRNECFPMVLLEALSYGVPAVAFNCATGPRDIINDGEDGLLIETGNTKQMAAALSQLMSNAEKCQIMGIQAQKNIQRFSADVIYLEWKKLIEAL